MGILVRVHFVAFRTEHTPKRDADDFFVIDHQDPLRRQCPWRPASVAVLMCACSLSSNWPLAASVPRGKPDSKRAADVDFALQLDRTAVLFDNPVADTQSQTRSPARPAWS